MTELSDLTEWISSLFDQSGFTPRSHCGVWPDGLKWVYLGSNATIAASYFAISAALIVLWRRRRNDTVNPWILSCFAAFILLCGVTHACDVAVWWWAPFRLYSAVDLITAVASVGTALLLPGVVRSSLHITTPEQYRRELAAKDQAAAELREAIRIIADTNAALMRNVRDLERMRRTGEWTSQQENLLRGLKDTLQGIKTEGKP